MAATEVAFTWRPILPELLLLVFVLALPLLSFILKGDRGKRDLGRLAVLGLLGAFVMVAMMMFTGNALGETAYELLEITAFSQFLKLVFLGVAMLVCLVSVEYATRFRNPTEYYTLILVATVGMMVVASARDFITLFIGIETASISSYILAGYAKDEEAKIEASTKYFVIGALSSSVFLYGISLFYGIAGSLRFDAMAGALGSGLGMGAVTLVAIVLVLVGLGFKISAVPFHMWAPDVYYGAPSTVAAFLSAGSKVMGFAAVFRIFLGAMPGIKGDWEVVLAFIAVATMTLGNLAALKQTSIRRMLGYSSIAHAGYLLIAVVVGTQYALAGGLFHAVTDAAMKSTAFLAVAAVATYGIGESLDDYKGLRLRNPLLALILAITMFSLAGIPPFAGFASKFALFSSAVYAGVGDGPSWLIWLAVAGILNSLVSLFYYARLVRYMYGEDAVDSTPIRMTPATTTALSAGLVMIVVFGLWPDLVWTRALEAAAAFAP